ncbi:hypothetical protein CEXT_337071 [Caerostris extrusa]|uniref:Uncharacterized protein n=1 Tax=Caerostris extrusa TaxID=172846 RepID=A0AAV4MRT4_CAEEX|nr:hypothetical protein CEXT_337071 [Caerostris extrusa]
MLFDLKRRRNQRNRNSGRASNKDDDQDVTGNQSPKIIRAPNFYAHLLHNLIKSPKTMIHPIWIFIILPCDAKAILDLYLSSPYIPCIPPAENNHSGP